MKKILPYILLFSIGCASEQGSTSVSSKQDIEFCPMAQAHLQTLCQQDSATNQYCCTVAAPTLRGKEFAQVCQEIEANGGIFINPKCISEVTDCSQIDSLCMQQPADGSK